MIKPLQFLLTLLLLGIAAACRNHGADDRSQITRTELDFAAMAAEKGIAEAFYEYAADSAVINRGGSLIKGKEAIREYYRNNLRPGSRLLWTPDFADVSGNIGYTYGKYTFIVKDSTGNQHESHGIFHTVWQRQPDGTWRFVWD
jgi:ketosteroid isomerase-like protein